MHRLALGAFLLSVDEIAEHIMSVSLNAPFGARCFLTSLMIVTAFAVG